MASPKLEVLELWRPIIFLMISSGKLNFEQWITESIVSWSSAVRRGWMSRNVGIWPLFRLCSAWLWSTFLTCSLPSHKHKKKSEHILKCAKFLSTGGSTCWKCVHFFSCCLNTFRNVLPPGLLCADTFLWLTRTYLPTTTSSSLRYHTMIT